MYVSFLLALPTTPKSGLQTLSFHVSNSSLLNINKTSIKCKTKSILLATAEHPDISFRLQVILLAIKDKQHVDEFYALQATFD